MNHLSSLGVMHNKYVLNMERNMDSLMKLDGNGSTISPNRKETSIYDKCCEEKSFSNTIQYIHSDHIPHDTKEALELNQESSNDYGKKTIWIKIQQLMDHDSFHDKGLIKQMPSDYPKI